MHSASNLFVIIFFAIMTLVVNSAPTQTLTLGAGASDLTNGGDQLTKRKFISYEALAQNNFPPAAEANKLTRGCSAITRCRPT